MGKNITWMMGPSTMVDGGSVPPGQDQVWGCGTHPGTVLWDALPHGWR